MKKVLLVTQNFYPEIGSGANRYKNIFSLLNQNGIDADVLTSEPSYPNAIMYKTMEYWNDDFVNQNENKIKRLKTKLEKQSKSHIKRILYYLEIMKHTYNFVKKNHQEYETIIVTSPNIFMPLAIAPLKNKIDSEIILDVRDLWPDSIYALNIKWINIFSPILNRLEWYIYNKSSKIVFNHRGFKQHILKRLKNKEKPMIYLPNSINQKELDEVKINKVEDFTVFYSGNLGFAQNTEELLEIAQRLNALKIKFDAIVYGLHANEFKQKVKDLKLQYVSIYEVLPRLDCLKFMKARHLSLSLLIEDDIFMNILPGKIVDSISLGVPVVSNIGNEASKMINNNLLGYAKEKANVDEIITQIQQFVANIEKYESYCDKCIEYTNKNLIWDKNINDLIHLIKY
ncbi:glycosyltransferase family 4 protein [Macrococcoides bohemicum]|uniref:Glycosyltransferase family 4 protein n=1 Tax=Macrococcoides bohemicum TaxID=1903056 RepID=A0AAE7U748_9STAP|nr:glycosyltransferase family 4 protein [Macrococcus bohemicus]MBC9874270.1 glycosyltransferase family 4 protein [Macrococcus bohemicus]QRN49480.1 glycosyltransferase family 4 protein [Macrococcus bohemicus]QYA43222.1 glycosyltransferase family 4 protein [Macrococcus bohemicus]QYA45596.1 glycosyltransferase family 4 protein [Macrococcus bohemicus]